jgi:predicted nucleotidyltransferase
MEMRRLSRTRIISQSDKELLLEVKRVVTSLVPDAELVLYGSAARGQRQWDSDYDILVLTDRKLSSAEYRTLDGAVYELQLAREAVLSMVVHTRWEWEDSVMRGSPYRRNVLREGVMV